MTTVTLSALIVQGALELGDGYRTKRSELGAPGYRIIRAADVVDGHVSVSDGGDAVAARFAPQMGSKLSRLSDIVLTTKGTIGRVGVVSREKPMAVYSPQVCFFRIANTRVLSHGYLKYWLTSREFWRQARDCMSNTDMAPYISLTDLRAMKITLPPLDSQLGIAGVLGALDDKIAANRRTLAAVNAATGAIVERASLNGELRSISDLATFINGRNFTKDATGNGRVVVRIAELNSGLGPSTVRNDVDAEPANVCQSGDVLFAWSGSLTVRRWFNPEALVNQHIFKVGPKTEWPAWLVFWAIQSSMPYFKDIAANKATTMGHIQRHHLDVAVTVPRAERLASIAPCMQAMWDLELSLEIESQRLAELRDTLLPHLMSGRLTVKAAENIVSDAV